jgi:hypothetical protein
MQQFGGTMRGRPFEYITIDVFWSHCLTTAVARGGTGGAGAAAGAQAAAAPTLANVFPFLSAATVGGLRWTS